MSETLTLPLTPRKKSHATPIAWDREQTIKAISALDGHITVVHSINFDLRQEEVGHLRLHDFERLRIDFSREPVCSLQELVKIIRQIARVKAVVFGGDKVHLFPTSMDYNPRLEVSGYTGVSIRLRKNGSSAPGLFPTDFVRKALEDKKLPVLETAGTVKGIYFSVEI
jgi:hypothetical protein